MHKKNGWIVAVLALAAVAAAGAIVLTTPGGSAAPAMVATVSGTAAHDAIPAVRTAADREQVVHAVSLGQQKDLLEPAAICRRAPECSTDSDCDYICGIGQGKCMHSRCPVRVCRCF